MPRSSHGTVPQFKDPVDYAQARARLADAGFTGRGITERLRVETVPTAGVLNHPLYLWRTRGGDALDTFIRLFLLYSEVPERAAREALRPAALETWLGAALLRRVEGDHVAANVRMLPYGDFIIVTDRPPRTEDQIPADFVMSVGAATITLADATIRRPSRRTLDLGCGCGTLGLLAARHSAVVYGLDRNARAVGYTRFNALLNGLENVRAVEGNLFEPVADLKGGFDLIVCNPPFVISPESRYLYRDSGMRGDEICRTIVRQAPQYLSDGGYCQMLCNWAHIAGQDWKEHLASWFEGIGCDAWVVGFETRDVAAYAQTWVRQSQQSPQLFEEWMAYYQQNGIEAVSLGLITLRRKVGRRNWVRIEDGRPADLSGDVVATGFAAREFLETADDDALMATCLHVAPDVRLDQRCSPQDGAWRVIESTLCRTTGDGHRGNADPFIAKLIAGCNGHRSLAELAGELAAGLGRARSEVAPAVLGVVRQLILQGFLLPADDPTLP